RRARAGPRAADADVYRTEALSPVRISRRRAPGDPGGRRLQRRPRSSGKGQGHAAPLQQRGHERGKRPDVHARAGDPAREKEAIKIRLNPDSRQALRNMAELFTFGCLLPTLAVNYGSC